MFDPPKEDAVPFEGTKVRVGGSFTQQFQALTHENNADVVLAAIPGKDSVNINALYPLENGFNLATANLNLDVQLDDGIRIALENYMSSRHHSEFWVKGGYIQVDKLPMFGNPEFWTKYFRAKIGHFQINYGDLQFRRTDNGNAMYNPFVGNYILDGFTTEIGGELYVFPVKGLMGMFGMTAGLINGDVRDYDPASDAAGKSPSIYAKLAYDRTLGEDFRFRLSASYYANGNTPRNTLYGGDRTGSRFYFAGEPEYYVSNGVTTTTTSANRFTSGSMNPGFTNEITAIMINPFIKWKGVELFGAYEIISGQASSETESRDWTQLSGEIVYRFLKNEQVFIGAKYNSASGLLAGYTEDVSIDRIEVGAGWFPTRNLMLKGEYVTQTYNDFKTNDYRSELNFSGFMIEAVVGF